MVETGNLSVSMYFYKTPGNCYFCIIKLTVMKKKTIWLAFLAFVLTSCGSPSAKDDGRKITVSIPPFAYFVEAVAGDDFKVSIMLPPGADHHIWAVSYTHLRAH